MRFSPIAAITMLSVAAAPVRAQGGGARCALTMSGAHSATLPCTARVGREGTRGVSTLTVTAQGVHLVVRVRGDLNATTLTSADDASGAALGVHTPTGAYWYFSREIGGRGKPEAGSYQLQLSSVGAARPGASGTLSAALPSGRAGGGVLNVTVRFE